MHATSLKTKRTNNKKNEKEQHFISSCPCSDGYAGSKLLERRERSRKQEKNPNDNTPRGVTAFTSVENTANTTTRTSMRNHTYKTGGDFMWEVGDLIWVEKTVTDRVKAQRATLLKRSPEPSLWYTANIRTQLTMCITPVQIQLMV